VPAWNQTTKDWVQEGKLVVLGVAQEQHADRCRLFAQWHQLKWPILYDPINLMGVRGVPIEIAIDEYGIVRNLKPDMKTFEEEFLNKTYSREGAEPPMKSEQASRPDLAALRRRAQESHSSDAWRELGDALVLWSKPNDLDEAINAYTRALQIEPNDGDANFRLGVCYRMRYESPQRTSTDFQTAVDFWTKARRIEPNRYIWRRRVEQYGPQSTKPYSFYNWVETAIRDIIARGEKPVELRVLPTGSEILGKEASPIAEEQNVKPQDPEGRILRDEQNLILADVTVVPPRVKGGQTVRVHVTLRPNEKLKTHWNNEADPLRLWVDTPSGWKAKPQSLVWPRVEKPESSELRHFEFELLTPNDTNDTSKLLAYVLYYVCEDKSGTCQFLRKDIPIIVTISN
jgi:tetratricopeptide (TPR) repeat protein